MLVQCRGADRGDAGSQRRPALPIVPEQYPSVQQSDLIVNIYFTDATVDGMELRHLDTVLAIAGEGSFTAAADALATVQSNVSEQRRQLEEELGVQLLTRTRRGAVPTERGGPVLDAGPRSRRRVAAPA